VLVATVIMAAVVFCFVQDRATADGARQYADIQRAAAEGRRHPVTVDEIMGPAVRRSVVQASFWAAAVMVAGAAVAWVIGDS
jgi:hypothetical protein